MELPPSATPLNGMLPFGGVGASPRLMKNNRGQVYSHDIDIATREMDVSEKRVNSLSRDTTTLWTAHYPELTDYVADMYDIGRKNLWLNGLVGQKDGGYETPETGSVFDITVPVTMPAWMKDFGLDKPKLMLQGTMDIRLKGYAEKDDAQGSTNTSLVPSLSLHYDPSFMVKGKIGPYITVEINNVETGLGIQNQVRVVYEESYKDEFEDYILQRVEAGTTSLTLSGTELTGYSENHQGLFGIKADWKLGDWRLTTIASQDGGSQEEYTINANESTTEFQILDKQFVAYRYYFLNHEARDNYISAAITGRTTSNYPATNLKLFKRSNLNNAKDVVDNITVVYKTPGGKTITKLVERMVEIPSSDYTYDPKTGILKINGVNRNTLVAASWSNDGSGRTGTTIRNGSSMVLIQWDATLSELTDIDKLMLRNVYSVGISDASSSSFVLRLKNKSGVSGTYLKTLGVADTSTGSPLVNDATIFKKDASGNYTGEMWLPCKPLSQYSGAGATERARENCLEPLRLLDSTGAMSQLYTLPVYKLNRFTSRFYFESVGKRRNSIISVRDPASSYSVGAGSCMDISPGTEKLTAGSTTLIRGTDYEVNYELGQIELLSERALDPNKEIKVTFECEPLFEIDNKLLLGARAELPLERYGFGTGSLFGVTALYKSQSTTAKTPTLGNEPFSSVLWGMNLRLQDTVQALTDFVNLIPGIQTDAKSSWRFEAEFAASRHNANTSGDNEALVEDFESTVSGLTYPLTRLSWYPASPPGGVARQPSTYIENQDYRHKGEFIWHSNTTELYKYIYPSVGNSDVDNQHLTVLKMTLRANDNLVGNSWGGIMRPNSSYYQDLSEMKYLEVVARGNVGSIYLDLGLMSEDISINGYEPNEEYDGENDLGTTVARTDNGLDKVSGSDEKRLVWDCRISGCISSEITAANSDASATDIAQDNYDEDLEDESDPSVHINGTENNSGERLYDTEDINKNGSLDTDISFVRYRIDLSKTDHMDYEDLKNGWRKWRIPLNQYDTIVSPSGSDYKTILAEALYSRLWIGGLNPGVAESKVQIVSLAVVGNS
ncbi:MAG: cell surface protein SprA, partial [Fibrobacter sp.]|nr:cell surface protein SprA [Fibrobacter sp.]